MGVCVETREEFMKMSTEEAKVTKKRKIMEEERKKKRHQKDLSRGRRRRKKSLNKRKRGKINGGTERKLTEADEGTTFYFAGKLKTSTNGIVCFCARERQRFNQTGFVNSIALKTDKTKPFFVN